MGMAHILYLYEDGLKAYDPAKTKEAVGSAILKLCLMPDREFTNRGIERVRSEAVLGAGDCVNHAGEVHSMDEQVFIWSGNCLRTLAELKDQEVEDAKRLFDKLYEDRRQRLA